MGSQLTHRLLNATTMWLKNKTVSNQIRRHEERYERKWMVVRHGTTVTTKKKTQGSVEMWFETIQSLSATILQAKSHSYFFQYSKEFSFSFFLGAIHSCGCVRHGEVVGVWDTGRLWVCPQFQKWKWPHNALGYSERGGLDSKFKQKPFILAYGDAQTLK